jgi:FMN phosphatase YigB (HAD superfamily)
LGTDQERHRTAYLKDKMFKGVFNDIIASYAVGYRKVEPEFWRAALNRIQADVPGIQPGEIAYFDDHATNVSIASSSGLAAHLYKSVDGITSLFRRAH